LAKEAGEGAGFDFTVEGDDTTGRTAPHHDMASFLTDLQETQTLERADDLGSGKVR
jgi:hypothetical protein